MNKVSAVTTIQKTKKYNMQTKLFFLLLLLSNVVLAQTAEHKIIPGSKCSIVPPENFVPATNFSGFQNNEVGASIMITELPAPLVAVIEGFTAEAIKAKGMTLISKENVDFNNSKAVFIKISQPANGITYVKQILIFGDSKKTVMVNGIYPEVSKNIEEKIKASLFSVVWNEKQDDNPLAAAKFKIDPTGTEFRFTKYLSGSLLYTTDGEIPAKSADKAMIVVSNSLGNTTTEDRKKISLERLSKLPRGESNVVKEISPVTIDNMEGFEIVAEGKGQNNEQQLVYQVMLFEEDGSYYILVGSTVGKFDTYLDAFKKIAKTFKRK